MGIGAPAPAPRPDPRRGVFETLLVRGGRVHALQEHLARLERSVTELYGLPLAEPELGPILARLDVAAATGETMRARIDAAPRGGGVALTVVTSPVPGDARGVLVPLVPLVVPGGLGPHKWRDRRLVEAAADGRVPLIVDAGDAVLEAAWANVWMIQGDELITPPADGRLLPGVTRGRLLAAAPALGLRALERPVTLGELASADGILLTSSLRLAVAATLAPAADLEAAAPTAGLAARVRAALDE